MFIKCMLLLFVLSFVESVFSYYHSACPMPQINNGQVRAFRRGNFLEFSCSTQYTLVGHTQATCRFGHWNVPIPVCVKTGCQQLEEVKNAVNSTFYDNAWVVFYCLPGHQLVGSSVLYCDGTQWNATTPKCYGSSAKKTETECNFEQPNICGWKQDEYHDFDWRRLNKNTPSSFLQTGPQYDHTYGKNGSGYYMYIESSDMIENTTARLMSPVYEADLAKDGCFVFWYHMFGRSMGGLMAYQKPTKLSTIQLEILLLQKIAQNYTLFKQWGDQGDEWHKAIAMLSDFGENFEIVIEGIRGESYTSDIAIDDVSIQHGDNCTKAMVQTTTPPSVLQESCVGRCGLYKEDTGYRGCSCSIVCFYTENCCPDFFYVCGILFQQMSTTRSTTEDDSSSDTSVIPPQTEELVATTAETFAPTPSSTTIATTMTFTKRPTIPISPGPTTTNATTTTTATTSKMPATTTTATKMSATTTNATEIPATTTTATEKPATTTITIKMPATTTTATEIPPTITIATEIPATTTTATEIPATITTTIEMPAITITTTKMPATNKSSSTSPSTSTTNTTTTPRPTFPRKSIPATSTSKIVTIDVSLMTYSTISVVRTTMDNAGVKTADVCNCECTDSGKG